MKREVIVMSVEGILLGMALVILWLVFEDRRTKEPWTGRELWLFGAALSLAIGGAAAEVLL